MADYNITAVTRRVVYTGSAGVGPYAFTFPVISQTDIAVYKNSTKLTLTTNYTVTVSSANGTGSVTLVVAATGSDRITIIGARAIERTTDFVTAGDLKASSLNEQLDASIILIQQLAEENKRTLKAPQFDPAAVEDGGTLSMVLPVSTSRAGKTLAFDTDGNPVVGEEIGNWRGNWAAGVSYTVRDLVKTSDDSNVYRVNTAHTSSGALPLSTNADYAKFDLVVDAAAAAASAAAAAASASAASTSASNASTSASNASASASTATTQASNASASASAAAASAASAAASFDAFDDIYLGAYSTNPTLDNDGNSLTTGDQYFNTTANELRVWNGSSWQAASVIGGTVSTLNVTGVASFADGSAALPSITNDGDTNTGIFFPAADTIAFAEGGAEAMRINSSGNVGIGETNPTRKLDVVGTASATYFNLGSDTASAPAVDAAITRPAGGTIALIANAAERLRIASAGQIGIGGANYGTSGQVLTSGGASAAPAWGDNTVLVRGTVVASTSGTSISFTGLPSSVKSVMVMFSGISTSGTSNLLVQLGYGATPTYVTSGYLGSATTQGGTSTSLTTGFMVSSSVLAADGFSGIATITNITGNAWTMTSMVGNTTNNNVRYCAGNVSTTTVLTAVRITTVNGTDTFDAGSINIMYE